MVNQPGRSWNLLFSVAGPENGRYTRPNYGVSVGTTAPIFAEKRLPLAYYGLVLSSSLSGKSLGSKRVRSMTWCFKRAAERPSVEGLPVETQVDALACQTVQCYPDCWNICTAVPRQLDVSSPLYGCFLQRSSQIRTFRLEDAICNLRPHQRHM